MPGCSKSSFTAPGRLGVPSSYTPVMIYSLRVRASATETPNDEVRVFTFCGFELVLEDLLLPPPLVSPPPTRNAGELSVAPDRSTVRELSVPNRTLSWSSTTRLFHPARAFRVDKSELVYSFESGKSQRKFLDQRLSEIIRCVGVGPRLH